MKEYIKLKEDVEEFIEERMQESYKRLANTKEYNQQKKKIEELEQTFINKLKEDELIEIFYNIKEIKTDIEYEELKAAYSTGFKDSINIFNTKNI